MSYTNAQKKKNSYELQKVKHQVQMNFKTNTERLI